MTNMIRLNITIILFSLLLVACDVSVNSGSRSGTINNDYIEEPISKRSKKYATALETSNRIIELIKTNQYKEIHASFVDDSMKDVITVELLEKVFIGALSAMGDVVEYKQMQWGFRHVTEDKQKFIVSYKILLHEKGRLDYAFSFKESEGHRKIYGFSIKPRDKTRLPNEA